jgi:endonuclease/exonuclease/phosphatase family metal-dependent hydrolase
VDLQRTIAAIRTLGEFDVLCLQEVSIGFAGLHDDGQPLDEVALLAAAFPGYSAHFAAGVDVPDGAGGQEPLRQPDPVASAGGSGISP